MLRHLAFILVFATCCFGSEDGRDISLENVLQRILKIGPPDSPVGISKNDIATPKHMLELYHKYISGEKTSAETVRSITAVIDVSGGVVLFNVSHVSEDEEVRVAELLLRRRRVMRLARARTHHRRRLLAPPARVRLFRVVGTGRSIPLASIPVIQVSRGGWHSLDITSALRELLLSSGDPSVPLTLGVRFEAPRAQVISPLEFLDNRDNSSAFLMVFSDEAPDNRLVDDKSSTAMEHLRIIAELAESKHAKKRHHLHHAEARHEAKHRHHKHKLHDGDGDIKELIAMKRVKKLKRHRKLLGLKHDEQSDEKTSIKSNMIDELLENSEGRRVIRSADDPRKAHRRRSIYDNELPYEKLHLHRKESSTDAALTSTEAARAEDEDEGQLIPFPPGMERKKKRRGRRGKKRKHRKINKIPENWGSNGRHHPMYGGEREENSSGLNRTCSRKYMVVNFADLGWNDWIIAPPSFNAYYCSGSCGTPISKSVNTTNHAIIQSLIHDMNKDIVPTPCCVPHSMGSLTVLYLESDYAVTLKNFSHMKVKTCSCQ